MPDYDCPELDPLIHPYVYSASQIETAMLCMRKWAFDKIDRLERKDTPATLLGGLVHGQIEEYLMHATPFNTKLLEGKIAMSGLKHLPSPKMPGMTVEDWFVRKYGPAKDVAANPAKHPTFWGKKDAEALKGAYGITLPIVWDHKTCGSFRYMKDTRDLQTGIQSGMYAWDALEATGEDYCQLRWTYMRTQGAKKSLPMIANISRRQAEDVMGTASEVAGQLTILKQELSTGEAIEAPANYSACEAFGGCERKGQCKPTAMQALDAIMTQKTNSSLLQNLRNRKKTTDKDKDKEKTEQIAEDKEDAGTEDKVNSKDRSQPPPPPPEAREVNSEWFQPEWDKTEWEWKFPKDYHEALAAKEAAAAAEAKNASKKKKSTNKKGKTSGSSSDSDLFEALIERVAARVAEIVVDKMKED